MPLQSRPWSSRSPSSRRWSSAPDGRLQREGLPLEMSAYDRRAVAQGVALARATGGRCTVITLGPAVGRGRAARVGRLRCRRGRADHRPGLRRQRHPGHGPGPGRRPRAPRPVRPGAGRSQLGRRRDRPGRARRSPQLLDLPFATGRQASSRSTTTGGTVAGRLRARRRVGRADRRPAGRAEHRRAAHRPGEDQGPGRLGRRRRRRGSPGSTPPPSGPGPWGEAGSPTWVGEVRVDADRPPPPRCSTGPLADQVDVRGRGLDARRGAGATGSTRDRRRRADGRPRRAGGRRPTGRSSACWSSPVASACSASCWAPPPSWRRRSAGASSPSGPWLLAPEPVSSAAAAVLASWGADDVWSCSSPRSDAAGRGGRGRAPWPTGSGDASRRSCSAPSTAWGREVAGRVAAELGLGLTGDAIGLELDPATSRAPPDGVEAGVRRRHGRRRAVALGDPDGHRPRPACSRRPAPRRVDRRSHRAVDVVAVDPAGRVEVRARRRDDDLEVLATARRVVSVGRGVDPDRLPRRSTACSPSSAPSWRPPARSPTRAGCRTRARSASPG